MAGVIVTVPLTTVTDEVLLVPPAPLQVSEKAAGAERAPVLCVPLAGFVPLQAPEAVQAVALEELQLKTAAPPAGTVVGLAVSTAVGTTETATLAGALVPPAPVQLKAYVILIVSAAVTWAPLGDFVPLQPPDAVHAVALAEVHVRVLELPAVTTSGEADSIVVGTTFTVALAGVLVPPGPVQVRTYVALLDNGPVDRVPLAVSAPLQLPEAAHDVVFVETHVKVALDPLVSVADDTVSVVVGAGTVGEPPPPQDASRTSPKAGHREWDRILASLNGHKNPARSLANKLRT